MSLLPLNDANTDLLNQNPSPLSLLCAIVKIKMLLDVERGGRLIGSRPKRRRTQQLSILAMCVSVYWRGGGGEGKDKIFSSETHVGSLHKILYQAYHMLKKVKFAHLLTNLSLLVCRVLLLNQKT